MTAYYGVLDTLKTILDADVSVNTVTKGALDDVALNKSTIYSLAHVMVNGFTPQGAATRFNISVICMDVVDISKEPITDIFRGNDNEDDVLNTQSAVVTRMLDQLRRGDIQDDGYHLVSVNSIEPFTDRFEDKVAGWVATFDIDVYNDMTIC